MGLFDFLGMSGNYEERKVANYSEGKLVVDTCAVTDSSKPYETGIAHPDYNDGDWIVVGLYDTKEQALEGHDKWVKKMKSRLPKKLIDVSTAEAAGMVGALSDDEENWRVFYRKIK